MAVVLRELPHAGESRERAGELVPVEHVEGDEPLGQLAVRVLLRVVEHVVRRAVHRLERRVVLPRLAVEHEKHVLLVFSPVPRLLPQGLVVHERGLDLEEAAGLPLAHEGHEGVVERGAARCPEGSARGDREEVEEVELLADDAVVALLRFFHLVQPRVEFLLREEGGGVDALQHLPLLVAAPVGARGREQLEVLEVAGVLHVRTAAQVDEWPVGVGADDLVGPEVADALELERIIDEPLEGLVAAHFRAHERELFGDDLPHLRFERGEVLRRERLRHLEVVVEAVVDRGAEADLRIRTQPTHRGREDVGAGVPQHGERARILVGDDREPPALPEWRHQVLHLVIHRHGNRRAQQAGADRGDDLPGQGTGRDLAGGAVGKGQDEHGGGRRRTADRGTSGWNRSDGARVSRGCPTARSPPERSGRPARCRRRRWQRPRARARGRARRLRAASMAWEA